MVEEDGNECFCVSGISPALNNQRSLCFLHMQLGAGGGNTLTEPPSYHQVLLKQKMLRRVTKI